MKNIHMIVIALICLSITGCASNAATKKPEDLKSVAEKTEHQKAEPTHNYSFKENQEYGYEPALNDEQKKNGQAVSKMMMFKYAGTRNGFYQVHAFEDNYITAIECKKDCTYVKEITAFANPSFSRSTRVERYAYNDSSVASSVITDALNGELEPYHVIKNGKKKQVWVDDKKGVIYF
jgi:hypothetical protein